MGSPVPGEGTKVPLGKREGEGEGEKGPVRFFQLM